MKQIPITSLLGQPLSAIKWMVSLGMVRGVKALDKFGENPDVDTGTPEDIWEFGGTYNYDADNTAPIAYISSSSAADTGQIIEITGLDINGNEVTQTATTNGQNNVTLTTPLWRVYRMANDADTGGDLAGILYCHTDTTPTAGVPLAANVRAIIDNGNNQTLMALYTVPAGKVGLLLRGEIGGSRSVASGESQCAYYSRRFGKVFKIKKRVNVANAGSSIYQDERTVPDPIPALTDIRLTAESVSANNTGLFATFDMFIVDEKELSTEYLASIGQPGY